MLQKMDDLPVHTTTLPKWMCFPKLFFKSSSLPKLQHSSHSNSSDDLCLLVCINPDFLVGGLAAYTLQGKVLWGRL